MLSTDGIEGQHYDKRAEFGSIIDRLRRLMFPIKTFYTYIRPAKSGCITVRENRHEHRSVYSLSTEQANGRTNSPQ